MALINLGLLQILRAEAITLNKIAFDSCYNTLPENSIEDRVFVGYIKTYLQVDNLYLKLLTLRDTCRWIALGMPAHYVGAERHNRAMAPIAQINQFFRQIEPNDLPSRIETYSELLRLSVNYASYQAKKRTYCQQVSPELTYICNDPKGEGVFLSNEKATPDILAYAHQQELAVMGCLGEYNDFYATCQAIIEAHESTAPADAVACANAILKLIESTPDDELN